MSKYTTGELAKLCGVSVRTVQYYDSRNILVPSELSEGGRRLYSEDDSKKLRAICFLREMGFSIDNIGKLFSDSHPERVISLLIEEQECVLLKELHEQEEKLAKLTEMKRRTKEVEQFSVQSLADIAQIMKNQKKRKKILAWMVAVGVVMDIIEIGTVWYSVKTGIWWPLMVGLPIVVALGVYISLFYFRHMVYICPVCHEVFRPTSFWKAFWASHTPNTRRLTCPKCGKKNFCVETYGKDVKNR